ncbi:GAK5 protein, partial [Lanius ludovicianus]|nr:GAK5 protein [Lanius ludovicianus]
ISVALAEVKGPPATSGVCFGCGKLSHFRRDCFALKRERPKTTPVCPRCLRGPHPANQCHSKYDSEGHLLQGYQGNWDQGMGRRGRRLTRMPQPPLQMPAPQMPASQMSAPQMPSGSFPQVFT